MDVDLYAGTSVGLFVQLIHVQNVLRLHRTSDWRTHASIEIMDHLQLVFPRQSVACTQFSEMGQFVNYLKAVARDYYGESVLSLSASLAHMKASV